MSAIHHGHRQSKASSVQRMQLTMTRQHRLRTKGSSSYNIAAYLDWTRICHTRDFGRHSTITVFELHANAVGKRDNKIISGQQSDVCEIPWSSKNIHLSLADLRRRTCNLPVQLIWYIIRPAVSDRLNDKCWLLVCALWQCVDTVTKQLLLRCIVHF